MLVKGPLLWALQCLEPLAFGMMVPLLAELHGSIPLRGAGTPVPATPPCCRKARIPPYSGPSIYGRGRRKPAEPLQAHQTTGAACPGTACGNSWAQNEGAYGVSAFKARYMTPGAWVPCLGAARQVAAQVVLPSHD